jgi:TetR/AcrR family transcriptional regulator, transcriptional repressor of bet genes
VDVDERRSELAAAASRVIARSGIAGASMREVAAEAGWTTGTLVHYFTDKHELLRFTLEESLERRHALRAVRESMAPDDALRDTLMSALPLDDDARLHWIVTVAFCAQAAADDDLADLQRTAYRDFRANVAKLVVAARRSTPSDSRSEAERLIAVVDGVAMQALFDPASWPPSRQRTVVDEALAATR